MDFWTAAWLAWGAAFCLIEGAAIAHDDMAGTLSDHLRLWFRTDTKHGRTAWLVFSVVFFVAWFIPHIAFGHGLS